jgi:hypothetical protein
VVDHRISLRDYVRGFNRSFWAAKVSEVFEHGAYCGMAPVLVPYLTTLR